MSDELILTLKSVIENSIRSHGNEHPDLINWYADEKFIYALNNLIHDAIHSTIYNELDYLIEEKVKKVIENAADPNL